MVLDKLGSSLRNTLKKIAGSLFVDEKLVNELIKDIQRALLQSDVNVNLVLSLTKDIKKRALDEKPPKGISPKEHLIKIVYEELVKFLGKEKAEIVIQKKKPFKIMAVGLFGSGKTTTIAKLANYYSRRGYKVAVIGLDVHRPAASEQLEQLADQLKIKSFIDKKEKDPIKIYKKFEKDFKTYDILIIDTAGRDALSKDLIEEIENLTKTIIPDETLLIISADIGQAAQKQAEQFHKSCNIAGIIITKLDGTAKGGGALTACAVTEAPIKFIGVGEKVNDLELFNPEGFVSRLLGMGDLEALLEKAKEVVSVEEAQDSAKKFIKGDFSLIDLYEQMETMSKMGPMGKIMDMIPGMSQLNMPKDFLKVQEGKLKKWKHAMQSMTKKELEDPTCITSSRIERISKGSGVPTKDIRDLVKQYKLGKKMMKMVGPSAKEQDINKLMKKLKGKMPF